MTCVLQLLQGVPGNRTQFHMARFPRQRSGMGRSSGLGGPASPMEVHGLNLWNLFPPHREDKAGSVIHWFPHSLNDNPLATPFGSHRGREPGRQCRPGTVWAQCCPALKEATPSPSSPTHSTSLYLSACEPSIWTFSPTERGHAQAELFIFVASTQLHAASIFGLN